MLAVGTVQGLGFLPRTADGGHCPSSLTLQMLCAALQHPVLGWAGLGCAVLCCAVLCCAVLCYLIYSSWFSPSDAVLAAFLGLLMP